MQTVYLVALMFSCGGATPCIQLCDGNGNHCTPQSSVTLPQAYATDALCRKAGAVWLAPAANPNGAVRTTTCVKTKQKR